MRWIFILHANTKCCANYTLWIAIHQHIYHIYVCICVLHCTVKLYRIVGKFGKIGKLSVIRQTNLVLTIDNLLADLLICQLSFTKCSKRVSSPNFLPAQLSHYTVCEIQ